MARLYGILAVVGWIWCVIAMVYLFIRFRGVKKSQARGFEVIERHGDDVNIKQQH